ncbi:hypothetical protein D3C86_1635260 [compost metagenome]
MREIQRKLSAICFQDRKEMVWSKRIPKAILFPSLQFILKKYNLFIVTIALQWITAGSAILKILIAIRNRQCFILCNYRPYRKEELKPIFLYEITTSIYIRRKPNCKPNIKKREKHLIRFTMPS